MPTGLAHEGGFSGRLRNNGETTAFERQRGEVKSRAQAVQERTGTRPMDRNKAEDTQHDKQHLGMNTPPIVSREEWEAARQQLLVKEKSFTRARDALAAERRRMPWMAGGGEEIRVRRTQG